MDPSHFRGSQHPTSHMVPGAPGAPGHPPHFGFTEPPFIIPAAFLTEIIMAIRSESAAQNRLLTNHYSSLKQDYNGIKEDYQLCVHQTDRILTEQYTRFELRLEDIQKGVRQFHETQTAAITDMRARLDAFESSAEASRDALASKITTVVEAMGHNFDGLIGMIKNEYTIDHLYSAKEVLAPAAWLQTDSELDPSATRTLTIQSPRGQDELDEGDALMTPITATGEPLVPPVVDGCDATTVPSPPPTIPTEVILITPPADHELLHDSLFDTPSPLTPISTPRSQSPDEAPIMSPEIECPAPYPSSSPDPVSRKRKRAAQGRGALKRSRRNRKSCPKEKQEVVPYGDHADPLIWPPVTDGGVGDQMYVECDRCKKWFHFGCVGLQADHEDGSLWECPFCVQCPTRDVGNAHEGGMCSRPGCTGSEIEEYFMERLVGRCYVPDQDVVKYLVAYEGYDLDQCTWEAPHSFSNDPGRIKEFLEWWATENPGVDVESLNPHETIFLQDVHVLARTGFTWLGA